MGRPMSTARVARPLAALGAVTIVVFVLAAPAGAMSRAHHRPPSTTATTATTDAESGPTTVPSSPTAVRDRPDDPPHSTAGDDRDDEPHHRDTDCDGDDDCDEKPPRPTTTTTAVVPVAVEGATESPAKIQVLGETTTNDEPGIYDAPRPVAYRSLPNTGSPSTPFVLTGVFMLATGVALLGATRFTRASSARSRT